MMQLNKKIKISEFLSVALQLTYEAGKVIFDYRTNPEFQKKWKGTDDPVTEADFKAQDLIIRGLLSHFPALKFVGEEEELPKIQSDFDFTSINKSLLPEKFFFQQNLEQTFDAEECIVWVDPLDGTLNYVRNELHSVTTLLGVSCNGKPLIGIIGSICQNEGIKQEGQDTVYSFDPKIYFSHVGLRNLYYFNEQQLKKKEPALPFNILRKISNYDGTLQSVTVNTQKDRQKPEGLAKLEALKFKELVKIGGCGKKVMDIITGKADAVIMLTQKASMWDICGGEALLNCIGGSLVGIDGSHYSYQMTDKRNSSTKGILACVDKKLLENLVLNFKDYEL